jgi:hypothetical protein
MVPALPKAKPPVSLTFLAVLCIGVMAALLPIMSGGAVAVAKPPDSSLFGRVALLIVAYGVAGIAAYRRSPAASAATLLLAAALGWAGWASSEASLGWLVFSTLVLLVDQPSRRKDAIAVALVVGWALFDDHAAWGALLLVLGATHRWRERPIVPFIGGIAAVLLLWWRGLHPWTALLPPARPWLWIDGQASNKLGDPVGLALFGTLVLVAALLRFGRGAARPNLLLLAVFGLLAWQSRRNGIWLGLVAAPVLAALLGDLEPRFGRWASSAVAFIGAALLAMALMMGPTVIGARPLEQPILDGVSDGTIIYRPHFERALHRTHPDANLLLANADDPQAMDEAWKRIAADCDPAGELDRLKADTVVLDSTLDRAPITTLAADRRWRLAAADSTATVFVRVGAQP